MKKVIFFLALLMTAQVGFSQTNIDDIFQKYGKHKDVTRVKIGSVVMAITSMFTNTMGVNGVEVLAFESCSEDMKKEVAEAIRNLEDSSYETMVSTNEGGERTKILVKIEKESIKEMVVLNVSNDMALVRIKGNIKPSDIEKIVKEHSNG